MAYSVEETDTDIFYITENSSNRMLYFAINNQSSNGKDIIAYNGLNVHLNNKLYTVQNCLAFASQIFGMLQNNMSFQQFNNLVQNVS